MVLHRVRLWGYWEIIGKIEDSRVKPDELAGIFTNFWESPPGLPN
jgi:hypothetical protein